MDSSAVAPPEEPKSSFSSPRAKNSGSGTNSQSRNQSCRGKSANSFESSMENVEQRFLERRSLEGYLKTQNLPHPKLAPRSPSSTHKKERKSIGQETAHQSQTESLTSKGRVLEHTPGPLQTQSELMKANLLNKEEARRIIDLEIGEKAEERESNLETTRFFEQKNAAAQLNSNLQQVLPDPVPIELGELESMRMRKRTSDSHDTDSRGLAGSLSGVKSKAEFRALKKAEWLENYLEVCIKQSFPLDTPDVVRSREVLEKYKHFIGVPQIVPSGGVDGSDQKVVGPEPNPESVLTEPMTSPVMNSVSVQADLMSEQATDGEVSCLQKQLDIANREIDKLRLERALVHANSEIKKLKTEIACGQSVENEDNNIDNIFPSSQVGAVYPALNTSSSSASTATANGLPPVLQSNQTPPDILPQHKPKRMSSRATKLSLRSVASLSVAAAKAKRRSTALELSSNGSEALLEEGDLEAYREEKRRKKKKKKFIEEMENSVPSVASNKKEINPLIKQQMQSFEFLNFLDSLDGLDGNTPQE